MSVTIIGSGPKGQFTAFAKDQETVDRWLREGFLHQHRPSQVPTHHQVCECEPTAQQ